MILLKKITNLTKHYMAKVFFKANRFRACTCTYAEGGSHDQLFRNGYYSYIYSLIWLHQIFNYLQ